MKFLEVFLGLMVLDTPQSSVKQTRRLLVALFLSGQHWTRAAVLHLPFHEGGQGRVDIGSSDSFPFTSSTETSVPAGGVLERQCLGWSEESRGPWE